MTTIEVTSSIVLLNETNNISLNEGDILASDYSYAIRTLGICIGIFDIIVGTIGNTLTLLAIITNKKLHKPFYIFIANLSVIDFLTASLIIPFNVASYYQQVRTCSYRS